MEADMKCIAEGSRTKDVVYRECLAEMEKIFMRIKGNGVQFKKFFNDSFGNQGGADFGGGGHGSGGSGGNGGHQGPGSGYGKKPSSKQQ
jgi:hypothetical protein